MKRAKVISITQTSHGLRNVESCHLCHLLFRFSLERVAFPTYFSILNLLSFVLSKSLAR